MAIIVPNQGTGPIQAVLTAAQGQLTLFKKTETRNLILGSLQAAGVRWITLMLPLRFTSYAKHLGYRVSSQWNAMKQERLSEVLPFVGFTASGGGYASPMRFKGMKPVKNGAKMIDTVLAGAKASSGKSGGQWAIFISIPYGHPINSQLAVVFKKIPPNEVQQLARYVAEILAAGIVHMEATTDLRMQADKLRRINRAKSRLLPSYQSLVRKASPFHNRAAAAQALGMRLRPSRAQSIRGMR